MIRLRTSLMALAAFAALASLAAPPPGRAADPEPEPTFATGLQFASDDAYRSVPLAAPPLMGELPARADLSAGFPEPGQQGNQGSCVGWAIAYAVRSYDVAKRQGWKPDAPTRRFSPAYVFNTINRSPTCQGSLFIDALDLLSREGVATEADFPYDPTQCTRPPTAEARRAASRWRIQTWRRVNVQDTNELKTHLAAGYPILIGAVVDQAFQAVRAGMIYQAQGGRALGGHAMTLVGYDDARQAFKVINSWGLEWGDRGFGWIGYGVFRQMIREGYVIQDFRERVAIDDKVVTDPDVKVVDHVVVPPPPTPTASLDGPPLALPITLQGGIPAAGFTVQGHLRNARGKTAQVVIRMGIQTPNGVQQIPANPMSPFRDFNGGVATGTQPFRVEDDDLDLSRLPIVVPLGAVNAFGTIFTQADVYVDNFNITRSVLGTFVINPPGGNFCCDMYGTRRCQIPPQPLGQSCFCPGQGFGATCP